MFKKSILTVGLLALTACVTPDESYVNEHGKLVSGKDRTAVRAELSKDFAALFVPMGYAESIGKNCKAYVFNRPKADAEIDDKIDDLIKAGYQRGDVLAALDMYDEKTLQNDYIAFIQKYDIVVAQRETFCPAGDGEVAAGSKIASYLSKRK